ncbi:MAG: cellulose-binding domain-containing protein [Myxococcota bacterium]|nr:cellulose-binding domain-containing protein [Myxococcota bacterium]
MKSSHLSYLSLLAVAFATGCSATDGTISETDMSGVGSALTGAAGVTAAVTQLANNGKTYNATVTISNRSNEPVYSWQVAVDFHTGSFLSSGVSGAVATTIGGKPVFTPTTTVNRIDPGKTYAFSFNGNATGASYWPSVTTVNGVPSGAVNAGNPADGIDHVSRAAASAALSVAYRYANDKLPNNPRDLMWYRYSDLIWDSHSYRVASDGKTIEFDPNVPGYRFIPNSAKAELAFAQLDPAVASYMVTGLASCFAEVTYDMVYGLATDFLHDVTFPGGGSGYRTNSDRTTDHFATTTMTVNGSMQVKIVETSNDDEWFGILSYFHERIYQQSQDALIAKYNSNGQAASCSPFNGPGGSSNPYLVISLNGHQVPARYNIESPTNCSGGCTSTAVIDPVPYAEPGSYYNANGALVGTQSNPFALSNTVLYADPSHASQWATRTTNSIQEWGTFSNAVTLFGSTKYKYVKQY